MKIKFCGAAREVTGSSHLITLDNGFSILLDCGLYQGRDLPTEEYNEKWFFNPKDIDCLVLSHAHIDHAGRIPKVVADGFRGKIYTTHATRNLSAIMLLDSASIQERDASYHNKRNKKKQKKKALYTKNNVKQAMKQFVGFAYDRWYSLSPDVELQFRDAGHVLGSANVTLRIRENNETTLIGFTGDIGRPNRPILRDPQPMPEVDYLLCESTYGNKLHSAAPNESERLLRIIKETCVDQKGKLIIPAFSLGRTQEIVYMFDQMQTQGLLPKIPVYVDSPLAVNATDIFAMHPECFDDDLMEYLLLDPNPFGFKNLHYIRKVEQSKTLNQSNEPCVIISSSGMANAGRVKHHIYHNVSKPKNTILIVGYCARHTPGGRLRDGAEHISLFREELPVKARVEVMDSFSAHADKSEMAEYIMHQRKNLKKLFLVHGEYDTQSDFKAYLETFGFDKIEIPSLEQEFKL